MFTLFPYLQLVRAPNAITALSNVFAAVACALGLGLIDHIDWRALLLLSLTSVSLYCAGMALNDYYDYREDLEERPTRPLPSGKISRQSAKIFILILFAIAIVSAYHVNGYSCLVASALILNIVAYDGFIRRGLAGSVTMAGCRYLNWLLGFSIAGFDAATLLWPLPIFFYITALTYLSKQETRAEDPSAMRVVALLLGAAALSLLYLILQHWTSVFQVGLLGAWLALVAYRLSKTLKNFSPDEVKASIVWLLIGIIPLDALMVTFSGNYWMALALLSLIWPSRYLSKKLAMT